jgi:hypothetical protein
MNHTPSGDAVHDSRPRDIAPDALPDVIVRYLNAHRVHDTATAIGTFQPDATVRDDGRTHRGTAAIETWLNRSASEYTYTNELSGAQEADARHCVTTHHLEGDFPGGVVDLKYRFALGGDLIESLVIDS